MSSTWPAWGRWPIQSESTSAGDLQNLSGLTSAAGLSCRRHLTGTTESGSEPVSGQTLGIRIDTVKYAGGDRIGYRVARSAESDGKHRYTSR